MTLITITQTSLAMKSKFIISIQCGLLVVCTVLISSMKVCLAAVQYKIAVIYEQGYGIKSDFTTASIWYHQAANNGHIQAQNCLGVLYNMGRGVTQDFELAFRWFNQAAQKGNTNAQHRLAEMYGKGLGVEQDYDLAFYWFQKANGLDQF